MEQLQIYFSFIEVPFTVDNAETNFSPDISSRELGFLIQASGKDAGPWHHFVCSLKIESRVMSDSDRDSVLTWYKGGGNEREKLSKLRGT